MPNVTLLLPDKPPDTPHITLKNITDDTPIPQLPDTPNITPDTPNITPETHNQAEPETQTQPKTLKEKIYEQLQLPPGSRYVEQSFNWW